MSEKEPTLFNTYIDYDNDELLDINSIGDSKVMQKIAGSNFRMEKRSLQDVLSDRMFNVPEYQRLFSWGETQHRQLWSDVQTFIDADLEAGGETMSDVFFSSMYFAVDAETTEYEVIDGQQRLTSIHLLLRVIQEELERLHAADEFDDPTVATLCERSIDQLGDVLYKFESIAKGEVPRLSLNKHDEAFFEALISGPEAQLTYLCADERPHVDGRKGVATQVGDLLEEFAIDEAVRDQVAHNTDNYSEYIPVYDSNWKILGGYQFYRERVQEYIEMAPGPDEAALALINLNNYIQRSYFIGEFEIHNAAPDFRMQIFEILNDRGIELTKIDRIRATVVNSFFEADDRDEYVGKWEDIVTKFGTDPDRIDAYLSTFLSIADERITRVGDASAQLTNAFATRNIESDIAPRFRELDTARDFLDRARELAEAYRVLTDDALKADDLALAGVQSECHEILVRLNSQRMDQWVPFVLELYNVTQTSAGEESAFLETLELIERLNFRRLLVGGDSNIFQEVFIEAVDVFHEAQDSPERDPYAAARRFIVDEMQSENSALFGDRFQDQITQAQAWNTDHVKLLFGKMANQHFRAEGTIVERRLNTDSIHLEHVLPQTLVYDESDPIWLPNFFRLDETDIEMADQVRDYLRLTGRPTEDLSEEERRRRDSIKDFIDQRFLNDIGNFVLLRDSDNISASNRPLAQKLPQYYNEPDDFSSIHVNRYFTADSPALDRDRLDALLEQYGAVREGGHERIDPEVESYFDQFWTYEALKKRRVTLLLDILETLRLVELPDEFGIAEDRDAVRDHIWAQTEEEFQKRLSMQPV